MIPMDTAQPCKHEGTFEYNHSSKCRPEDSVVILEGLADGCEPAAWANQDSQRDPEGCDNEGGSGAAGTLWFDLGGTDNMTTGA